jgi:predicted transcriptional regulator
MAREKVTVVEIIFDETREPSDALRWAEDPRSGMLSNLAKERQRGKSISYADALEEVAREYPDLSEPLSAPVGMLSRVKFSEAPGPSAELARLAKARQREKSVSYGEALTQVAQEHPELTGMGSALSSVKFAEDPNPSVELARLAQARQSEKNISYGEALAQIAKEHPELIGRAPAGRGAGALANDGRGHFTTSSPTLLKLAAARMRAKGISHQDALDEVAKENPELAKQQPEKTGDYWAGSYAHWKPQT